MHAQPLAHADQPVAGADQLGARPAVTVVGHEDLERVVAPGERDLRRRAAGVLDRVGQRLLYDAVDRELGAGGQRPSRPGHRERDREAGRTRALDQRAELVERRLCGPLRRGIEDAEQQVHLGERLRPGVADARRGLLGTLGVAGEDPACAAGLHDHQADAVRDDVVHLARDPAALLGDRLQRLALALLGCERGRLVQLGGVLQPEVHAAPAEPAERDEDGREVDVAGRGVRARQPDDGDRDQQQRRARCARRARSCSARRRRRSSAAG